MLIASPTLVLCLLRLHRLYQRTHDRLHSKTRPLKLYYLAGEHESILGWVSEPQTYTTL